MGRLPVRGAVTLLLLAAFLFALAGCSDQRVEGPTLPTNHDPVIDSLVAVPDTIGPSDSTVVTCFARDPDNADRDSLVYDWLTDSRLRIPGQPAWDNNFLNNQPSPRCTFCNTNLPNPINDSAWVYCSARDPRGGGAWRQVFIILRRPAMVSQAPASRN